MSIVDAFVKTIAVFDALAEVFDKKIKVAIPEYLILLKLLPLGNLDAVDIKMLAKKADMGIVRDLAQKHFLLPKLESVYSIRSKK